MGQERSSSGREEVGYKHDQAIGRARSWILGDRDNRVDLIGSGNLASGRHSDLPSQSHIGMYSRPPG